MSVVGVRFSEEFFKTVFVQFSASAAVAQLSAAIQSHSVYAGAYHIDPHLSLIYKNMSPDDKNKLAGSLRLPFDEVMFDSVWLRSMFPTEQERGLVSNLGKRWPATLEEREALAGVGV